MAAKPSATKKPKRGKQHPVKATSFSNVAADLKALSDNELVDTHSNRALLRLIADVFRKEGHRVQKIVR